MSAVSIIAGIGGIVKSVLPRFVADKDKAAEIGSALELELARSALDESSAFYKLVVDYEGTADQAGKAVVFIRSIVRPLLTVSITAVFLWGFLHPADFSPAQLQMLEVAWWMVLGFWFGPRAVNSAIPFVRAMSGKEK